MVQAAWGGAQDADVIALVVDAKGFVEAGPWGDVMTTAAMKAGIAGLVIHGAVRDSASGDLIAVYHAEDQAGLPRNRVSM